MEPGTRTRAKRYRAIDIVSFITAVTICTAVMMSRGMDIDSYYMIPQGREILESGIPYTYDVSYYPGLKLVVQQWAYTVIEYIASLAPHEIGLMALYAIQFSIMLILAERYLSKGYDDPFWLRIGSILCCTSFGATTYWAALRPENITIILLLAQILTTEKYLDTNHASWLMALPISVILEMNLHATMWPFHFCIIMAYLVPIPKSIYPECSHVPDKKLVLMLIPMTAALFIQPYGVDGITYLFRSMSAFNVIQVPEQQHATWPNIGNVTIAASICLLALLIYKKRIKPAEAYTCAGFAIISSYNWHAMMFIPLVILPVIRASLRFLASKHPAHAMAIMPASARRLLIGIFAVMCICAATVCSVKAQVFRGYGPISPVIEYLQENTVTGNILAETGNGSKLYYAGFRGRVQGDSRHEIMSMSVNRKFDGLSYIALFMRGVGDDPPTQISDYLNEYNIQYVVLRSGPTTYTSLKDWLVMSSEWQKTSFPGDDGYDVWEKGET